MTKQPISRCIRCRRRNRGQLDWTAQITETRDAVNGFICPACTTPEEHLEVLTRRAFGKWLEVTPAGNGRWWNKTPEPEPAGDDAWKRRISRAAGLAQ